MTIDTLEFIPPGEDGVLLVRQPGATGRWMPPVLATDESIPGQDGTRWRSVRYDARQVVVPIDLHGESDAAYRAYVRGLARTFNPKRGEGVLRANFNGQARDLRCRYLDGMGFDESLLDSGKASLLFRAVDPFWYDTAATGLTFTPTSASFFPILPLRLSGSEVYADAEVVNDGDVETWPAWTITGPGNDPILRNLTTGEAVDLTGVSLERGERILIDTAPGVKSVRSGDGVNLYGDMTPTSVLWALPQGRSSVRLEMSGATPDTSLSLVYRRRWLSA